MLILTNPKRGVLIVLDAETIERIRRGDPAEFDPSQVGIPGPRVIIGFGDSPEFNALVQQKKTKEVFEYIYRGFEFRPDLGDHDDGPQKLSETN